MINKQIIERFKLFQKESRKYNDLTIESLDFEMIDLFNDQNIKLIGSKKLDNHDVLTKIRDLNGLPVYDASCKVLTYISKDRFPLCVFINKDAENPDLSFANEGNSSAGTNFIFHSGEYFINNHRTVIDFSKSSYKSKYVFYCLKDMKQIYGFKRGYIPSQAELQKLKIKIPVPKQLNEKYTSLKIQDVLVDFFEHFNNSNIKKIQNTKSVFSLIVEIERIIIPLFFQEHPSVMKRFDSFCKKNCLTITSEHLEFEEKKIISNDNHELVGKKRMGFTPKRDPVGNINWFTVSDLNKYPGLFINQPDTSEKTSIELIKESISEKSEKFLPIQKGDVLISFKLTVGVVKIYNSTLPAYCNEAIDIITPFANIESRYLAYICMVEYPKYGEKTNNGVTLNDSHKKLMTLKFPKQTTEFTSYEIQRIIADFIEQYFDRLQRMKKLCMELEDLFVQHTQYIIQNTLNS